MIRFSEVRVIGADNEPLGVMSSRDAMDVARGRDLDLVLIAEAATPPVCKVMNYGKYKYEQAKKQKDNKKKQAKTTVKEIKLAPRVDTHDYDFKMKHAKAFLIKGHRVKITLVFRGRENMYKDLGAEVLKRVDKDLEVLGTAERKFFLEGKSMMSNYMPDAKKIKLYEKEHPEEFATLSKQKPPVEETDDNDDEITETTEE
ncbi:MAG: translation initiation factor IF-3 [Chitinivibrionia bacterium]|nr:translation initiation factor IF-3 [Chitinivibrionia bacterium]